MSLTFRLRHLALLFFFLFSGISCGHISEGDTPTEEEETEPSDVVFQVDGFDTRYGLEAEQPPPAFLADHFHLTSHTISSGGGSTFSNDYFLRGQFVFAPQTTNGGEWSLTGGF